MKKQKMLINEVLAYFLENRRSHVDTHRREAFAVVLNILIWTNYHSIEVSSNLRWLVKNDSLLVLDVLKEISLVEANWYVCHQCIDLFFLRYRVICVLELVWDHVPLFGNNDTKIVCCSKIWLIEYWENVMTLSRFEICVQILSSINFIDQWMKTHSIISVLVEEVENDFIFTFLKTMIESYHAILVILVCFWAYSLTIH